MPKEIDDCVESVMEDNPSYSESRAYGICYAQQNEGNLSDGTTPEDVGKIAAAHNIAPECAMSLADGRELDEDDPCWENYEQVGMKTDANGNEVPNCVPAEDVENSRATSLALAEFDEGQAVVWEFASGEARGRINEVVEDAVGLPNGAERDAPEEGEANYIIDEWDDENQEWDARSVVKSEDELDVSQADIPTRPDDLSATLSESRVLAHRTLAGPITRKEQSDGSVVYENIKILSAGNWTDSNSRETIRYDPKNLEVVDGAPVNVMHDSDNEVAEVGEIEANSAQVEDGDLYADVVLHRDNAASEFADENLQKTLESEGRKGFGGPSVEIPADGQEIDTTSEPPELEDGKIDGLAFVNQPAAKTTAFDQQVRERAVAMSDGDTHKGVYTQDSDMSDLELQDPGEVREILEMFGADVDELDDEEVMDMAEDLHDDLMEELQGDDMEAEEHGEEEDGMDMGEMREQMEMMEQKMEEMKAKEDEMESEMQALKDSMDMAYEAEQAEELEAELEDTKAELSEAKDRIQELEDEPQDPKSLSEDATEWETTEVNLDYDSARQSF